MSEQRLTTHAVEEIAGFGAKKYVRARTITKLQNKQYCVEIGTKGGALGILVALRVKKKTKTHKN